MNEETLKRLKQTTPEDFDGHTAFAGMTPDQRLTWLEEANAAYLELHGLAALELRVAEAPVEYKVNRA